ncbi:MAG: DNA polymerase II large subunit [Nitrososphaerales archaeon]
MSQEDVLNKEYVRGAMSDRQKKFQEQLLIEFKKLNEVALKARAKGFDPSTSVESILAYDLADRVELLLGIKVSERLRELLESEGSSDRAALILAEEVALGKFGFFEKEEALDWGVRVGLAVVTEGVTVAPLQGISSVKIKKNEDGSNYASIYFAGPIRSAGGTEAAFTVVLADRLRIKLGLDRYRCNCWGEDEVGRFIEELRIYEREVGNFQFKVSDEDIQLAISNLPVEINGVETDPVEVVVHRGMRRIETDRVRGGALRVLNDGIIGRGRKLAKLVNTLAIPGWDWLSKLKGGVQRDVEESRAESSHFHEIIAGRPALSFPNKVGGFRLRYGRCYNTGFSVVGMHPAVPVLVDYAVVVGTQVKLDVPGKAATVAFVDQLEPPIVKLNDGSVVRVESVEFANQIRSSLRSILYLGDILISFGDFLENNARLIPSCYVEEWWAQELKKQIMERFGKISECSRMIGLDEQFLNALINKPLETRITCKTAFKLSEQLDIPLHPRYLYFWDLIQLKDVFKLRSALNFDDESCYFKLEDKEVKQILETLGVPHEFSEKGWVVKGEDAEALKRTLRLDKQIDLTGWEDTLSFLSKCAGVKIRQKSSWFVGVRVGRPEKAIMRKMKPPVHVLFPVGEQGGTKRDIVEAASKDTLYIELINAVCENCGQPSLSALCRVCGVAVKIIRTCPNCGRFFQGEVCPICRLSGVPYKTTAYPIKEELKRAEESLMCKANSPLKGVKSLMNFTRVPEDIRKGILRQKYNLSVYKDGTIRFDATNASLTHFKPNQIGASVEKLKELGYATDIHGRPLEDGEQILELFVQDVVIPIDAADHLLSVSKFVDEMLIKLYGLNPVYNFKDKEDLIGCLIVGLAPHTSVGVLGRVIGFTKTQVCYAHPFWHSAKRRDCDGDGDSIMLLLDLLINFSKEFLPEQIGGLMDAPLLLQPIILPREIQRQAHNFDCAAQYPLAFYEATLRREMPQAIANIIDIVKNRLNKKEQYEGFQFTHSTQHLVIKRARSSYSTLKSIVEKLEKQVELATLIKAVDPSTVIASVLKTHILRDIQGNLNAYTTQKFRCRRCGESFRRIPLRGSCLICGDSLLSTVSQNSIEKYVDIAAKMLNKFDVEEYLKMRFNILTKELEDLFGTKHNYIQSDLLDYINSE